jgi:uncharacterized membrane protein
MKFSSDRRRKYEEHAPTHTGAIRENIDLVLKLERDFLARRSFKDRVADAIGDFSGSMVFVLSHFAIFAFYILANTGHLFRFPVFDPFPFPLLSMAVSVEAIFLSTFVLMKQNRMSRRAESRAHLDLQINLLTEKEMTLVLQMLHVIGEQLGVSGKFELEEVERLSRKTPVERLATELNREMPE